MQEVLQTLGSLNGKLVDARRLRAAEVVIARERGGIRCPVCAAPLEILVGPDGPIFAHQADHEPEDRVRRKAKERLLQQLQRIFPQAKISLDVELGGGLGYADFAIVRDNGARIAITYRSGEMKADAVAARSRLLLEQQIRHLWLLDARRLNKAAARGAETQVRAVTLKALETALLAAGEPLIYVDAKNRTAHWVIPPPAAFELVSLGLGRVGQLECLIRRYRFSQLRIREGRWWADGSRFDSAPPPVPPLPKRLQAKLAELRAKEPS